MATVRLASWGVEQGMKLGQQFDQKLLGFKILRPEEKLQSIKMGFHQQEGMSRRVSPVLQV